MLTTRDGVNEGQTFHLIIVASSFVNPEGIYEHGYEISVIASYWRGALLVTNEGGYGVLFSNVLHLKGGCM